MPRRSVTLREIARRTGVHTSTVSRALNARTRHLVADAVADRIAATARELGYRPNVMAAALRTHRSMTVGVVADDLADPATAETIAGIESALREAGYATLVVATDGDAARAVAALDAFDGRSVDGVILLTAPPVDTPPLPTIGPADIDDGGAAAVAITVGHLAGLGHRAIGFLAGPDTDARMRHRLAGFRTAMTQAQRFASAIQPCSALTEDAGRNATTTLLNRRPGLTAIVAADDQLAFGALAALAARKLRCPAGISVVGIGDLPAATVMSPPLTTVRLDRNAAGRGAAQQLLARLHETEPVSPDIAVDLRVRGTTAPPPTNVADRNPTPQADETGEKQEDSR